MLITEIKEKLSQERGFGSRFPARIIFAESLDAYSQLETQLKGICDITINIADYCRSEDTVPQFDKIKSILEEYAGKQVLLLSVGEYLRLCIKRELNVERRQFLSFWETQQAESSKTRIIMPMFCCRDLFDRVVGTVDERQQDYVWMLDSPQTTETHIIYVYSPKFKDAINPDAENLTVWLRNWQTILRRGIHSTIVTIQESNVESSFGTVAINPIDSPFRYLVDFLTDGNKLEEKWANSIFWNKMVTRVSQFHEKVSLKQVALAELNVNAFDFVSAMARWETLDSFQKELIWLWYRVYPTGDYYSYACGKACNALEIPDRLRDEIMLLSTRSIQWIEQRMAAMKALNFTSFSDGYFELLDKLPLAETKLQLITYQTHEERTYAIKVISGLLRDGAEFTAVADIIENNYPALAAYIKGKTGCDESIDEYMSWYKKNKLINRYPGECTIRIAFDKLDARYKLVHQLKDKNCAAFWIDGFGVEYTPLFLYELKMRDIIPSSVKIATALLPTETEFNHQWDDQDSKTVKWDRLDSCSHKGMPDDKSYFSCIVHQLDIIAEAANKVEDLLKKYDSVVITGDHGSSRFAALAFHDVSVISITAPNKSTIRSYGRFCELDASSTDMISLPGTSKITAAIGGKTFLVMDSYQHFSTSGNVAGGNTDDHDVVGETHGGNTPEERLVPVIVVRRTKSIAPLSCVPKSQSVTKKNGHIETTLSFNQPVSTLEVSLGEKQAICTELSAENWQIVLDKVTTDDIVLSIIANGRLLPNVVLKIKKQGIVTDNDPFGGKGL